MIKKLIPAVLLALLSISAFSKEDDPRIEELLSQMTLEEKIGMLHANTMFSSGGVERLGIPSFRMSDGPHGVRWESIPNGWASVGWTNDACSYLPALGGLTQTWNRNLARRYGEILGAECKARGKHVSLAPGVNITRSVLNGRTWEYMSEDPFLNAEMAVPYIQGVQSRGVASCVKHWALNSQAYHQYTTSSEVDERAMHEIYMPAFEAAVQRGGALAVMPAYNKVRGAWCSESKYLIDTLLRGELGFRGVVISDWNGVHNTVNTAMCGTDIEMGTAIKKDGKYDFENYYFSKPLLEAVRAGQVPEAVIDSKVRDILRVMLKLDIIGKAPYDTTGMAAKLATPEASKVALEVAQEAVVLLKNTQGRLPLARGAARKIAVIGANADTKFAPGGGSTKLKAKYEVTVLEGLRKYLGSEVEISYAPGFKMLNRNYVAALQKFTDEFDRNFPELEAEAVKIASEADVVIYVGGLTHEHGMDCEGFDRPDMKLPYRQDELLSKIFEVNKNVVVVLMAGSPVELGSWYEKADAVLQTNFMGMEGGNALPGVLFGDVNPSGKLANTWAVSLDDMPDHVFGEYPGENELVYFKEGIMVGYRYFDSYEVAPKFEFGYGLSYTSFGYSDVKCSKVWKKGQEKFKVSFVLTNTGNRDGAEICQLYVKQASSSVVRPEKELKGFEKVYLKAGESTRVEMTLDRRALQWYNPDSKSWTYEPGSFNLLVGASSKDIRLTKTILVK